MTKRTFTVRWLVFIVLYAIGGLCCVAFGIAWYQNEKDVRVSELMKRVELSLKPIIMVGEVSVPTGNYYIPDNEDFVRLFHLEPSLLFFSIEGTSDTGEPFEFSYCPSKKVGGYSKYPKLYPVLPEDSPERRAQKESLNREIMRKVEEYQKQVAGFRRPPQLDQKKIFHDAESQRLYVRTKIKNKGGGDVWAAFDAADIARVSADVFKKVTMIGLVALLILILPAVVIAKLVVKPLDRLVKQLTQQVENLDLSKPLDADISLTEIKQVATSMNSFTEKLNQAIAHAQKAAYTVGSGASQQAAAVEETSSSMEEMAAMTRQTANNAQEANNLVIAVSQEIHQANASMESLTRAMEELTEASDKIAKIIKAIDEIAFQTNLLALNAAVEAARAGEAGAGFAVVADEVRTLAQRATKAASSTADLIKDTVKRIEDSGGLVDGTNRAFEEVSGRSKKVRALVEEIAAASQEQAQGIEQVNKALAEMDKTTQQNATQAEELTTTMSIFTTAQRD